MTLTDPRDDDPFTDAAASYTGTIAVDEGVLTLTGEIDTALVGGWRQVHTDLPALTAIHAAGVTFMGSATISLIVDLCKVAAPERIQLIGANRRVLRPLHITGVDRLLDLQP